LTLLGDSDGHTGCKNCSVIFKGSIVWYLAKHRVTPEEKDH